MSNMTSLGEGLPNAAALVDETLARELRSMMPDAAAWHRLVRQFEIEAATLLADARTALEQRNDARVVSALHRLRGAAAAMAASRLDRLVARVETDPSQPARWREARQALEASVSALDALA